MNSKGVEPKRYEKYEGLRQVALLTSIPTVLAVSPAVGYWVGDFLDRVFLTSPWLMAFFTVLGVVSGVRQTAALIKRVGKG